MSDPQPAQATVLLAQWREGDAVARERLISLLHGEMRSIARRLMRKERAGHTLQPTAVVNEACLRLLGNESTPARNRAEFLGLSARVMRQVLVDHARKRDAEKRGGDWVRVSLSDAPHGAADDLVDTLDLDAALERLAALNERQARVAELRYFGGLSIEEAAEVLGVAKSTVKADWTVARAWLARELGSAHGRPPGD